MVHLENTCLPYIELLNLVELPYPIILVAGTNGKGSLCAYLSNMLMNSGYKVGTFTSPHIFKPNERITVNNVAIDDFDLECIIQNLSNPSLPPIAPFAQYTLCAHYYFKQQHIDIAIIEVGIGGKHDVTNLFTPLISAITNVSLDHCNLLGNNVEEIGVEKAGIFRSNQHAFYGSDSIPSSVIDTSNSLNNNILHIYNKDFGYTVCENSINVWTKNKKFFALPYPGLRGKIQLQNVCTALAILHEIKDKFPCPISAIKLGILQTKLLGRFDVLPGVPQIIIDVAHNPSAVKCMLNNLLDLPFARHTYAVFGIANDKDLDTIIALCAHVIDHWFIAPIQNNKSTSIEKMLDRFSFYGITKISTAPTITSAFDLAELLCNDPQDRIVCFGSFLVAQEIYSRSNASL